MKKSLPNYKECDIMEDIMKKVQEQNLTLQDYQMIRGIIHNCSKRGAFSGDELATVGGVYDKLNNVIARYENEAKQKGETNA
tara:strand:- start:181 stop:426 length:246 start_codon:yes stop_codon:yes gene_type:complete